MEGMDKLTAETGLVLMPQMQYTPQGVMIVLSVVDKPVPPPQAVDKIPLS